jgi:type I restriction enzyme S subunit
MAKQTPHIPSGYKPSPLGPIPEDWEVKRLGEVCTFLRTNTLSRNQLNDTDGEVRNIHYGDVLIKYPSIIDIRKQSIPFVNQEDYKESMNDFIEDGDVVLADTAEDETVGKACEIANVGSEKILSGLHTMLIRPQKGLFSPWFLGYQVNSVSYRKQLNALVQGIKVCSLGKQAIANTYFAIPPLHEQQSIVSVLSLWDTAIAKQTALIEKLSLRKRGLMQQLLTGKKRLEGFSGEWKEVRLGEVCPMERGEMLTSDNYLQGDIPVIAGGKEPAGFHSYANRQKNTITISCSGASAGFVAFHDVPIFATDCFTISESNAYNIWFIYHVLTNLQEKIYKLQTGGAQPHVHPKDVYPMKIHVPSIKEQNAIASVLVNADKEIEIQKQKLAAMQEQKRGLMQVLLSGKKRIN